MQLHLNSQARGNERNYSGEPRNIQGGTLKRNPSGPWLVGSTQNIHVFPWIWEPVMEICLWSGLHKENHLIPDKYP